MRSVDVGALYVAVLIVAGTGAHAQVPGATISGVVHDSIARRPLAAATVQLVSRDVVQTTTSDTLGRFTLTGVPDGSYTVGFLHVVLDSLGLEPIGRSIDVRNGRPVRVDLAIPSAARMRTVLCGPNNVGVVIGVVRDARDGVPVPDAEVTAQWLELAISGTGIVHSKPSVVNNAWRNGWFALCDVPGPGAVALIARRSTDSTDRVDVTMPDEGFLRRDLYLGSTATFPLSGVVVAVAETRPIAEAQVSVRGAPPVRTNERGEWTIPDAPAGTRALEVRAVGYYPEQRAVDVIARAPHMHVALLTTQAMLDTIRIAAQRLDRNMQGFEQRRRAGMGRFLTRDYIAQHNVVYLSNLLRGQPGLPMSGCSPVFYINGLFMGLFTATDIDAFVTPDDIAGIEIYRSEMVPPQFSMGMGSCATVVIWTQSRPLAQGPRASWKRRLAMATAFVGAILIVGFLISR